MIYIDSGAISVGVLIYRFFMDSSFNSGASSSTDLDGCFVVLRVCFGGFFFFRGLFLELHDSVKTKLFYPIKWFVAFKK